ncbi:MAG: transglycosylase SLT domain-containing protein [Candidatus Binatia bacterium]
MRVKVVLLCVLLWPVDAGASREFSPSFLGMYRKTMVIENVVERHAKRYRVDMRLARAVLLQESGGNPNLVSRAGARGYFQVMPATFRMLGVRTNIEAGIKYLSQMSKRFGREDYAVAAYNAGPGSIGKRRPVPLETLQYVMNVGHYKSVLRLHEKAIRQEAAATKVWRVKKRQSWQTLSRKTGLPVYILRLYNPFLANRALRHGDLVSYPRRVPDNLFSYRGKSLYYRARIGDSYLMLARVFGVTPETMRADNELWRLQQLPVGLTLKVALEADSVFHNAAAPTQRPTTTTAVSSRAQKKHANRQRERRVHRVARAETLTSIARRYGTSVRAIMRANRLPNTQIQAGASLVTPGG